MGGAWDGTLPSCGVQYLTGVVALRKEQMNYAAPIMTLKLFAEKAMDIDKQTDWSRAEAIFQAATAPARDEAAAQ